MSFRSKLNPAHGICILPFYRRRPLLTGAVVVACVGAVMDFRPADDYSRYHNRVFAIANVVDGDTIDVFAPDRGLSTTRVRFWGVDTPEVGRPPEPSMYYGPEASAYVKRLLEGGEVRLVLSPTKTRGLYGRLLAYVHTEPSGQSVNEALINTGHAYADWRFPHPLKRRFMDLETKARRKNVGLWSSVTPELFPPWRRRMESELGLIEATDASLPE